MVKERRTLCLVPKKTDMTKFYYYSDMGMATPWREEDYPSSRVPFDLGNQP